MFGRRFKCTNGHRHKSVEIAYHRAHTAIKQQRRRYQQIEIECELENKWHTIQAERKFSSAVSQYCVNLLNYDSAASSNLPILKRIPVRDKITGIMVESSIIVLHFASSHHKKHFYSLVNEKKCR